MTGHRDRYEDVGRAMRQAIDRALPHIRDRKVRTLLVALKATGTYSKLEDRLYLAQMADDVFATDNPADWQVKRIGEDLSHWADLDVLERDPPRVGRPRAGGPRYRVALPPAETAPPTGPFQAENGTAGKTVSPQKWPRWRPEMAPLARGNGTASGGPTEESSEKSSEGEEGGAHVGGPDESPVASGPAPLEEKNDPATIARRLVDRKPDEAGPAIRRLIADYDAELVRLVLRMLEAEGAAYGFARQLEADARHRIDELDELDANESQADEATPSARTRIPAPGDCPARGVEDWHTLSPSAFAERNPDDPTDRSAWPCPICNPHGPGADSPDYPPTLAAIRRDHYPELYEENTDP